MASNKTTPLDQIMKNRSFFIFIMLFPYFLTANANDIIEEPDYDLIKNQADSVIKICGFDKSQIYNLYVATLDSLNTIHGSSRDSLNSNIKDLLSTNNLKKCPDIKADAYHIVTHYKMTLNTHTTLE